MRNPRTGSRWQRVLGLALVLTLTLVTPVSVSADAGTSGPGTPPASGNGSTQPSGTRVTSQAVNLRTDASTDSFVVTIIPPGSSVTLTGNLGGEFAEIRFGDATGWVEAEFLFEGTPGAGVETPVPTAVDATRRTLSDEVNLRTGPDTESEIIAVLAAGETVDVTGDVDGEFAKVTSANGTGWVAAQFLLENEASTVATTMTPSVTVASTATTTVATTATAGGTETPVTTQTPIGTETPGTTETPSTTETPGETPSVTPATGETPTASVTETATADVTVTVTVTVEPTQAPTQGTTETPAPTVTVPGETATVGPTETTAPQPTQTPEVTPTSSAGETPSAPVGNSLVVWPIKGGSWTISQGYNGSSHQNNNDLWQYLYSFDIVPTNGEAAGQSVYSPVNGTVRWFDPSTGGISIDMGGGLAFAMFHMEVDGGLQVGDQLTQGQFLGTISAPGGGGNGGFPHLHITAWSTSDGGNYSRQAIPFTGSVAISGTEFPANGASQQYTGLEFTP